MYGKSADIPEARPGFSGSSLLNSYKIEEELGSGGNGAVYKVWHKRLRKHLVIKENKDGISRTIEVHRNEIEALKNIKSLYIPQVFDFLLEDSNSYTVMEYIEGNSFDKLLNHGKMFNEADIVKWYYQLARALEAIHKYNVCHRDIKPSNIMLSLEGDACLIDFNTALVSGNNTRVINRSLGYASPEQHMYFQICDNFNQKRMSIVAEPQQVYNHIDENGTKTETYEGDKNLKCLRSVPIDWKLSDIYSLGATMYHLLTGKRPPVMADEKTVKLNLYNNNGKIADIVKRSMQINPKDRFSSATDLCNILYSLMW